LRSLAAFVFAFMNAQSNFNEKDIAGFQPRGESLHL
jgi:hypothetical protein